MCFGFPQRLLNYFPSRDMSFGAQDLQLPVKTVPRTTQVVSSNPVHANVY